MSEDTATKFTPAHGAAGLRWLATQDAAGQLRLSSDEQQQLLGIVSQVQFTSLMSKASTGNDVSLPIEILERLRVLISIYASLKMIVPDAPNNDIGDWIRRSNSANPFNGLSAIELLLIDNSLESMRNVAHYFLCARWR